MLVAVSWMPDCYEPWVVVVRPEGQQAGGRQAAAPTFLSKSPGFVALEDWSVDDPTAELVTMIMEKQHAGGRLLVVVGPPALDMKTRFMGMIESGACELLGGWWTHASDKYILTAGATLREYLNVRRGAGPGPMMSAVLQEGILARGRTHESPVNDQRPGAKLIVMLAGQWRLRLMVGKERLRGFGTGEVQQAAHPGV